MKLLKIKKHISSSVTICQLVIILDICQVLSMSHYEFNRNDYRDLKKIKTNRFVTMQAACTRDVIMVITTTQEPFHGMVYAKGYPLACHKMGNSTREVTLVLNVTSCGVKIFEQMNKKLVYEVHIYVQYDGTVQQATDEQVLVSCSPVEEIPIYSVNDPRKIGPTSRKLHDPSWSHQQTGRNAPKAMVSKLESMEEESTVLPPTINAWMDILSGKSDGGKAIHEYMRVGEEATMLIKIQQQPGLATRVINCIAHDGSGDAQQELIDANGCAIENSIMPSLQEKVNPRSGMKFVYAPFAAFKFPDKDNLHLKCQVIVCIRACPPIIPCVPRKSRQFNRKDLLPSLTDAENFKRAEWHLAKKDGILVDTIDVFNAFEVKAPQIELDNIEFDEITNDVQTIKEFPENTTCLSTSRMILTFGILLGVVVIALVFSVSMFVWSRRSYKLAGKCLHLPFQRPYESYS